MARSIKTLWGVLDTTSCDQVCQWLVLDTTSCDQVCQWLVLDTTSCDQVCQWLVLDTTSCDQVCQWLAIGQWFSQGTPVSSTNKTDCHYITEILLKMALSTIKQTNIKMRNFFTGPDIQYLYHLTNVFELVTSEKKNFKASAN